MWMNIWTDNVSGRQEMNGSKDLKTIIYFKGVYDTLDLFTDHLIGAFESMGYGTFVYHTANEEVSKKMLLRLLGESQEFAAVTFNNLGYNLSFEQPEAAEGEEGKPEEYNIWDYFHIPYIDILMDHPFHYEKPLCNMPKTAVILCTDRNHVKYVRRFFKNIRQTDFLPHAGVELGHKHKPLQERKIDVLYAGALPVYTVAKMIPDLHSIPEVDGEEMMRSVLGELVQHPEQTTEQAIEAYVKTVRGDISDRRLQEIIVKMRFLDSYATSFFREQAVRILVESGIHVTYGGKVLAPQILPLMNDSKIVLNTMTWFKAGAHDRIFNGMLAGAAVVTDDSTYLRRTFTDGKELVMFSLKELQTLPERVFDLFGHSSHMQELADCGYRAAKEGHTWKNRAEYIRECYFD